MTSHLKNIKNRKNVAAMLKSCKIRQGTIHSTEVLQICRFESYLDTYTRKRLVCKIFREMGHIFKIFCEKEFPQLQTAL